MSKICLTFCLFQKVFLFELFEHPIDSDINNVELAKQMFFVLFINFSLADENMIKRFFDEHMKDVVVFVFKEQVDQTTEKLGFTDLFVNFHTRHRDTVT